MYEASVNSAIVTNFWVTGRQRWGRALALDRFEVCSDFIRPRIKGSFLRKLFVAYADLDRKVNWWLISQFNNWKAMRGNAEMKHEIMS